MLFTSIIFMVPIFCLEEVELIGENILLIDDKLLILKNKVVTLPLYEN